MHIIRWMKKTDQKDLPRKKMVVEEVPDSEVPAEEIKNESAEEESILTKPDTTTVSEPTAIQQEVVKETNPEENSENEEEKPKGNSKTLLTFFAIVIVFISGFLIGGVIGYKKGVSKQNPQPSASPEASPTPTAEAPASETIDLTKYTIGILNGSGIKGLASKMETLLKNAGFKTGTAGNAKTYDYKKTVIQAKDAVDQKYLDELNKTLSNSYVLDDKQKLEETEKEDVIVVIGSEKPLE